MPQGYLVKQIADSIGWEHSTGMRIQEFAEGNPHRVADGPVPPGHDGVVRCVPRRWVIVAEEGSDASRLYQSRGFTPADSGARAERKPAAG